MHNNFAIIANVYFTGAEPTELSVNVKRDGIILGVFRAVRWTDVSVGLRQFIFFADKILKSYMSDFDDFVQTGGSVSPVQNITSSFDIEFFDPASISTNVTLSINCIHAAQQFGQHQYCEEIYNNDNETYIAYADKPVYIYGYNNSIGNYINVTSGTLQDVVAQDHNGDIFTDHLGADFTIEVVI